MGKIILTSGGYLDGQRGSESDKVIEKVAKGKRVLFVDNCTLTGSNVKGMDNIISNFEKLGCEVVRVSLTEDNLAIINNGQFDVIYITGGDSAPMLDLIAKTNVEDRFANFLTRGGTIIGESCGSIILAQDAKWYFDVKKGTKPKYDVELPSYKGMRLVDVNIYPHWNKAKDEMKEKVCAYERENNIEITPLQDGEFIEIEYVKELKK